MEIWRAHPGDEHRVKAAEDLFDNPVDVAATRRFLADSANWLLIADVDGRPAGFVSGTAILHPDAAQPEVFLNELAVAESFQGRGIGSALVGRLWREARDSGCRGMWVLTDAENVAANKVYSSQGGTRSGTQVMYEWG